MSVPVIHRCNECRHFDYWVDGRPICMKDHHIIKNHVNGRMPCSDPKEE